MARFRLRRAKKRYLDKSENERLYEYDRIELPIPKKYHTMVEPFLKREVTTEINWENGTLFIHVVPKNKPSNG